MSLPPAEPPTPGDPRSSGPRPPPRARDVGWLVLAVALVGLTLVQLGRLAHRAATDPEVVAGTAALLLAFAITVLWLLTIYWLAAGAWRRTVWGCPFDHESSAPRVRRCPRHRLIGEGAPTDPSRGPPPG